MRSLLFLAALAAPMSAQADDGFDTFFVVVGISTYPYVPELPEIPNAEADCRAFEASLQQNGVPAGHIVALCGAEAGRERFFAKTDALYQNMRSGDTLVFVWTGHGVRDDTGAYFLPASAGDPTMGGGDDRIHPYSIMVDIHRFTPAGTNVFVVTDAEHEGTWGDLSLDGPDVSDFNEIENMLVVSGTKLKNVPTAIAGAQACFQADTVPVVMTYKDLAGCMARTLMRVHQSPNVDSALSQVWMPAGRTEAKSKNKLAPVLLASGAGLAAIGLVGGVATYRNGSSLYNDIENDPTGAFNDVGEYNAGRARYNTLRTLNTAFMGVGVVGVGIAGTSVVVSATSVSFARRF